MELKRNTGTKASNPRIPLLDRQAIKKNNLMTNRAMKPIFRLINSKNGDIYV
jgi:hypothetical protein